MRGGSKGVVRGTPSVAACQRSLFLVGLREEGKLGNPQEVRGWWQRGEVLGDYFVSQTNPHIAQLCTATYGRISTCRDEELRLVFVLCFFFPDHLECRLVQGDTHTLCQSLRIDVLWCETHPLEVVT